MAFRFECLVHMAPEYAAHIFTLINEVKKFIRIVERDAVKPRAADGNRLMMQGDKDMRAP